MNIVADQSIPLLKEFFGDIGPVLPLPGREIKTEHLADASVLLVRSVTRVNAALLANTPVQFVGSCTAGVDHLDTDYLNRRGIAWANAPGCNAGAVVQYVLSAMAAVAPEWLSRRIAIIGCGNIGRRLLNCLIKLGVRCVAYDPLLSSTSHPCLVPLKQALRADIISCHTPLTRSGPFPTYHMLGAAELAQLRGGSVLINSARGSLIDQRALLQRLEHQDIKVVLDVWENEPAINSELLEQVAIATAHIAGYSLEGRERGTLMVYQALSDFLGGAGHQVRQKAGFSLLNQDKVYLSLNKPLPPITVEQQFNEILLVSYNIERDWQQLCNWRTEQGSIGDHFEQLRRHYPVRREYQNIRYPQWADEPPLSKWLSTLQSMNSCNSSYGVQIGEIPQPESP